MIDLWQELKDRVQAYGYKPKQLAEVSGYGHKHVLKVFRGDEPGSIAFWNALLGACERLKSKETQ